MNSTTDMFRAVNLLDRIVAVCSVRIYDFVALKSRCVYLCCGFETCMHPSRVFTLSLCCEVTNLCSHLRFRHCDCITECVQMTA